MTPEDDVDQVSFSDGDRMAECRILRRKDGERRSILSIFTIRRSTGRLDAFISGSSGLQSRPGVTDEFVRSLYDDMRAAAAETDGLIHLRTEWETVDLSGCSTIVDDVEAAKKAGAPMAAQVDGDKS